MRDVDQQVVTEHNEKSHLGGQMGLRHGLGATERNGEKDIREDLPRGGCVYNET